MIVVLRHGLARLAHRPARALLGIAGIAAAAAMVGAATTVAVSFATGFDRAARAAGLPDVVATFSPQPLEAVAARVRTLPNVRAIGYRLEVRNVQLLGNGQTSFAADLEGVRGGPRGYAIVAGRDVRRDDEAVVERGLARAWRLRVGDTVRVFGAAALETLHVVGIAVSPETLAYPLVHSPRVFVPYADARRVAGAPRASVSTVLLWVHDRSQLDVTLAAARTASFGVSDLQFLTRNEIHALIQQAAGIVIALLVAFAVVALGAAAVMLAASAAADVQRRLDAIGIVRALGATPNEVAAGFAAEAALVAVVPAAAGLAGGWLAVRGPSDRLLVSLNELAPGSALLPLLAAAFVGTVAVVALAAAVPARRAAARTPVELLRGGDVVAPRRPAPAPPGPLGLGLRLALARPLRAASVVAVLATSSAVALLLLAVAGFLRELANAPETIGKRYQLEVSAPLADAARLRRLPGVLAVAPRYDAQAADSFDLGESFDLVAFPGDHTVFEAPALAAGRRVRAPDEAEVGVGLAEDLDLHPGSILAAQLGGGEEVRFRVVGVVRALDDQGRIAYVQPQRLLPAEPYLSGVLAVRLRPGASTGAVREAVTRRGSAASVSTPSGFASHNIGGRGGFIDLLVAVLRTVAILDVLVCLYALAQVLALTAQERRRSVAVLRALGAGRAQVVALFAASALVLAAAAAPIGIVVERFALGPEVARLAVSYVALPLGAGSDAIVPVLAVLAGGAIAAAAWAAHAALRTPVAAGLREE